MKLFKDQLAQISQGVESGGGDPRVDDGGDSRRGRGGGFRGSERGGGYRGSDRGGGYRGSDRGGGYRGNDRGGGYRGYRGSERGGGYRGSERGGGGYRGADRGSLSSGRGTSRGNFQRGGGTVHSQGELVNPDFEEHKKQGPEFVISRVNPDYVEFNKQGGLVNPEFNRGRGGQGGMRPPYRGRGGGMGDHDFDSKQQTSGLVNPEWQGRGVFQGGRSRGRGGQWGERQNDSAGESYRRDEEEGYGESYYGEDQEFREHGREDRGGTGEEGDRGTNEGDRYFSAYKQTGEYCGGADEGWSEESAHGETPANQGGTKHREDEGYDQQQSDRVYGELQEGQVEGRKLDYGAQYSKNSHGESASHDQTSFSKELPGDSYSIATHGESALGDGVSEETGRRTPSDTTQPSRDQYGGSEGTPESLKQASKLTGPTISSLQKGGTTTVIPGLGSADEPDEKKASSPEPEPLPKEEQELKTSLKTQLLDVFSGTKAAKMVESMERIVNQLQKLKGLESSLKVLQGDQKKEAATDKEPAEVPEVDQEEAARKQVAALLASESDSDGEVTC